MLTVQQKALELLDTIERFAQRKFRYRTEISTMLELAVSRNQKRVFEDIMFLAKFLWNSYNLMQRLGPMGEEHPKLTAEFRESLEKFSTLMKALLKEGPDDIKESYKVNFFTMSQESMNNLIQLASELSWLKNYSIDTKQPLFGR